MNDAPWVAPAWRRWRIYLQIPDYRARSQGFDHDAALSHDAGAVTFGGLGRFAEDPQVSPAGTFDTCGRLHLRVVVAGRRFGCRGGSLTDGVGQSKQIVGSGLRWRAGHGQAQHFPTPGNGEALGVLRAEVVGVRFGVRG